MKKRLAILFLGFVLLAGTAWAVPDGIWKNTTGTPAYSFYVQTYAGDDMLVIVAPSTDVFWVFQDADGDYTNGFNAGQDLGGGANSLSITFTSDNSALANMTLVGQMPSSYTLARNAQAPASGGGGGGNPPTGSLASPTNGQTVSGSISISGTASDDVGLNRVGIRIGGAAEVNASLNTGTGAFSYTWFTTSVSNGAYSIMVTAYDTEGLSTVIGNISVTVNNVSPPPSGTPTLVYPANGASVTAPFDLEWTAVTGAVSYTVQIAADNAFTVIFDEGVSVDTLHRVISGTGQWWWRVRANLSGGGFSGWSSIWSYNLGGGGGGGGGGGAGTTVALYTPADGSTVGFSVPMTWSPLAAAVGGYHVEVSYSGGILLNNQSWPYDGMDLDTSAAMGFTLYWRVRANLGGGSFGPWSATWSFYVANPASDRNLKENFGNVAAEDVLAKVAELPVSTWNYKKDTGKTLHMGPMAQDFHAAFGLGDDTTIFPLDANGVAFAAIQEMNRKLEVQSARIEELEKANAELRDALKLLLTGETKTAR
ncbi:MAG: tail fiber domain-containing protein [Deltaproteobacteria bacterium]|nr:tail fiber domain-containing protein [Deltaproteobacteria bacterium]